MPRLTRGVPTDDDDQADYGEHPEDAMELVELTSDIATILAGVTVVPAAIMWWRARRERPAARESQSRR